VTGPEPDEQRERLFDGPCWVVDFLPRQVPPEAGKRFFPVERYLMEPPRLEGLYRRFARLALKLSCYYGLLAERLPSAGWVNDPAPEELEDMIRFCAVGDGPRGVFLLFPAENAMLTLDGGDLYMTLYGPGDEFLETVRALGLSEGLFVRRCANTAPEPTSAERGLTEGK